MGPYPLEQLEERRWAIALGVSQLLENPAAWRHRRTERFELRSADEIRRHVSVDFTVPTDVWPDLLLRPGPGEDELGDVVEAGGEEGAATAGGATGDAHRKAAGTGNDGQWVIPLGWLARGPLVGFDLRQDGTAIPLLLASETEIVTRDLLELELDLALGAGTTPADSDLAARAFGLIDRCVAIDVSQGTTEAIEGFAADYGELVAPLAELMRTSAAGFLLLVLVPRVDRRQLVKLAFDEAVPRGSSRSVVFFDTPGTLEAASSHLECPLPVELRARRWCMQEAGTGTVLSPVVQDSDHPALYVTAAGVQSQLDCLATDGRDGSGPIGVRAEHVVDRWRFHHPASLLAALATVTVAYGAWVADLDALVGQSRHGPILTLLLAGLALFVALLLRFDEHSMARRMLRLPRALLILVLMIVLVAAGALAFAGTATVAIWRVATVVLVLLLVALVWTSRT